MESFKPLALTPSPIHMLSMRGQDIKVVINHNFALMLNLQPLTTLTADVAINIFSSTPQHYVGNEAPN